jgi:hypothetical protein
MEEDIELVFESPDGVIDCRLEPQRDDEGVLSYSATILYPARVGGFNRSEIYCHTLLRNGGGYYFEEGEQPMHPKVKKLEAEISVAIIAALKK